MPRLKTQYLGKVSSVQWAQETIRSRLVEQLSVTMTINVGRTKTVEEAVQRLEELKKLKGRDAAVYIQ